jgi:type IV secretion system protein VirB11
MINSGDGSSGQLKDERFLALLGPLRVFLEDDRTNNIDVNEDGSVFIERFGVETTRSTMSLEDRIALISYLANAQLGGSSIDHLHARFQADMPMYPGRIQAFAPPIANWALMIRLHSRFIYNLRHYVNTKTLSNRHFLMIDHAITSQKNIAISGNMNSGKTTLLNACLDRKSEIFPMARAVIVQDRHEIQADGFKNRLFLTAKVEQSLPGDAHSKARTLYGFSDALEDALRANGDFIVWGEVRDSASASGLIMATNTGSRGLMMTTHANSCEESLYRLEELLRFDGRTPVRSMIARMMHVLVYMERDSVSGQRKVVDVQYVRGVDKDDQYLLTEEIGKEER